MAFRFIGVSQDNKKFEYIFGVTEKEASLFDEIKKYINKKCDLLEGSILQKDLTKYEIELLTSGEVTGAEISVQPYFDGININNNLFIHFAVRDKKDYVREYPNQKMIKIKQDSVKLPDPSGSYTVDIKKIEEIK